MALLIIFIIIVFVIVFTKRKIKHDTFIKRGYDTRLSENVNKIINLDFISTDGSYYIKIGIQGGFKIYSFNSNNAININIFDIKQVVITKGSRYLDTSIFILTHDGDGVKYYYGICDDKYFKDILKFFEKFKYINMPYKIIVAINDVFRDIKNM